MQQKKVISIIEPVGGHGGMDYYDYGLAQGLANNGVKVHLYTCDTTQLQSYDGVETFTTFRDVWKKKSAIKLMAFLCGYCRSFRAAKKQHSAVVHLHFFQVGWLNLMVLWLARFYRFQKVVTIHDVDPFVSSASRFTHKKTYQWVDKVIVHNTFSELQLEQKPIDPDKIYVIPHGNYRGFVHPLPPAHNDGLHLLFFGQIKEVKGLEILLEALSMAIAQQPNIHLTIAGRPWHHDLVHYQKLIVLLGLMDHVTTHFSYIPNEEVANYFETCDLVVLPYKRIYQSGVLLLAMSYNRACLASDLEPFREIIQDGENGYLFRSENAQSLADKLIEIANDKQHLDKVRTNASALLDENFNWNTIGKMTLQCYGIHP